MIKAVEQYNKYARNWSNDASYFMNSNLYQWMEDQIRSHRYVLEIGCGTGASTEILLSNGHKVVAVEENPCCLETTYLNLKNKYKIKKIKRSKLIDQGERFRIKYSEILAPKADFDLLLLDGNILFNDPSLLRFLSGQQFDAVVCWLIGTDGFTRSHTIDQQNTGSLTPLEYRLFVQKRIYHLASDWLADHGVLHFVDRGLRSEDPAILKVYLDAHYSNSSQTRFIVSSESLSSISYDPNPIINGVKMSIAKVDPELSKADTTPALNSIIASLK
jgi:SAM-dependent methyltransferase